MNYYVNILEDPVEPDIVTNFVYRSFLPILKRVIELPMIRRKILRFFILTLFVTTGCSRHNLFSRISSLAESSATNLASHSGPTFNFSPVAGPVGTVITIQPPGTVDFSMIKSVVIGEGSGGIGDGMVALPISFAPQSAVVFVMPGTQTGTITVTTSDGEVLKSSISYSVTSSTLPLRQLTKLTSPGILSARAEHGSAVNISADGLTAIVGAYADDGNFGAAVVYVLTESNLWIEQAKLVAADAVGLAHQGSAVSLSADGNTALVGGYKDNSEIGATWVYVRNNGKWTEQAKLVGTDVLGMTANQGYSVALSADGNTAVVGGYGDNSFAGATWVFIRQGTTWHQQAKLISSGLSGAASEQGGAVAVSADGKWIIVGGDFDNSEHGANWIFRRIENHWVQQAELVARPALGSPKQGTAVALSADGQVAISGGSEDNSSVGAAWIFTQQNGVWSQRAKLVGSHYVGKSFQGLSVSLSADGTIALIGGPKNDSYAGGVWAFQKTGAKWQEQAQYAGIGLAGQISQQGFSLSLNANASTAIIGAPGDNEFLGASWVYIH